VFLRIHVYIKLHVLARSPELGNLSLDVVVADIIQIIGSDDCYVNLIYVNDLCSIQEWGASEKDCECGGAKGRSFLHTPRGRTTTFTWAPK